MCAEILGAVIKKNYKMKDIIIGDTEYKRLQFTDDTTLMLDNNEDSLKHLHGFIQLQV